MKPDFFEIIDADSSRTTADIAVEAIADKSEYFQEVMDICLHERSPLNWRAARVIALSADLNRELFIPYVNDIAQKFPSFKNDGVKRSLAWILSKYTEYFNEESQSVLVEVCFKYMLSDEKIAVKYNCMKLLFEISKIIPELKGELLAVLEFNISEGIFRFNGELKKIYKAIDIQMK